MMIVAMLPKVIGQTGDTLGEKSDLHLGGTRVGVVNLKARDNVFFLRSL